MDPVKPWWYYGGSGLNASYPGGIYDASHDGQQQVPGIGPDESAPDPARGRAPGHDVRAGVPSVRPRLDPASLGRIAAHGLRRLHGHPRQGIQLQAAEPVAL